MTHEIHIGTMDRPLEEGFRQKRRTMIFLKIGVPLIAVSLLAVWAFGWVAPSVERNRIRTGIVEYGAMDATITASGLVVPEFEEIVSSPVDARVLKIIRRPGDSLHKDEPILTLDVSASLLALDQLKDRLALKRNAKAQLQATLEGHLITLESNLHIKQREVEFKAVKNEQDRKALEKNFISKNDFRQSTLDLEQAKDELQRMTKEKNNLEESTRLQQDGLAVEIAMLQKEAADMERQLVLATTKAERNGILTWVTQTEGATVHKGDMIARIADLNTYRVEASVSDVHAAQLAVGLPVQIQIDTTALHGMISSILPTIENGIVRFTISLARPSHVLLRSNLRVDVLIITAHKSNTIRMKKGVIPQGTGQNLFVIHGNKAVKTPVRLGITNADYDEVLEGLHPGDEVILSDMTEYAHLKEVRIRE